MPRDPARLKARTAGDLDLPPPFRLVRLRELGDAFGHAVALAPPEGAGTLVYVGRFDLAEFALVLEPDEPLRQARRVLYAGMAALVDALAARAEPETMIEIDWPDTISVNGGVVGGGRIAWPPDIAEDAVAPWVVFGAMIRTVSVSGREPGLTPLVTALEQEGFSDVTSNQVVESFARHFMVGLDAWQERGFAAVAKSYLERLPSEAGVTLRIDDNGDLLVRRKGGVVERRALLPRLAAPGWFDPAVEGPRTA